MVVGDDSGWRLMAGRVERVGRGKTRVAETNDSENRIRDRKASVKPGWPLVCVGVERAILQGGNFMHSVS